MYQALSCFILRRNAANGQQELVPPVSEVGEQPLLNPSQRLSSRPL